MFNLIFKKQVKEAQEEIQEEIQETLYEEFIPSLQKGWKEGESLKEDQIPFSPIKYPWCVGCFVDIPMHQKLGYWEIQISQENLESFWKTIREGEYAESDNLSDSNLQNADLQNADLRGADLSNTILLNADLRGADLTGANLVKADLRGADLRGAKGISRRLAEKKGAKI
jgi:hypothetical protein